MDGGGPATGLYSLAFSVFDASTNGVQIASVVEIAPVAVSNGLFSVLLGFGVAAFTGDARWLEIAVTPYGSAQPAVRLTPRQRLNPTPYSLYTRTAGELASAGNQPLELKVNNTRILRLEATTNGPNIIGGFNSNYVSVGVTGATISGGGAQFSWGTYPNSVGADYGTVAGGVGNTVLGAGGVISGGEQNLIGKKAIHSLIAGGFSNTIEDNTFIAAIGGGQYNRIQSSSDGSIIAGGNSNTIESNVIQSVISGGIGNVVRSSAFFSTIAGGSENKIYSNAYLSVISGGYNNSIQTNAGYGVIAGGGGNSIQDSARGSSISGGALNIIQTNASDAVISGGLMNTITKGALYATIPGGSGNVAGGVYSLAAGYRANARHDGTFVWSDSTEADFASTRSNQFLIRATGGVGIGVTNPVSALQVSGRVTATSFSGSGDGLSFIPDAALSLNIVRQNGNPTFSGKVNFDSSSGVPFAVSSTDKVINLNVDLLDGLDSTGFWKLGGNGTTQPGTDFIGTVDNQPLEFKVNGARSLRLEPGDLGAPNVVGGCESNRVGMDVFGATIAGGGSTLLSSPNIVVAIFGTIGGGGNNSILEEAGSSVIGGGYQNTIQPASFGGTISGGEQNTIGENSAGGTIGGGSENQIAQQCYHATVAGGLANIIEYNNNFSTVGGGWGNMVGNNAGTAVIAGGWENRIEVGARSAAILGGNNNTNGGYSSTIGGGDCNVVRGVYSVIPGGVFNSAEGQGAFAAGRFAHARHDGSFVWNGSGYAAEASSDSPNQFVVRATGGVKFYTSTNTPGSGVELAPGSGTWSSLSDRDSKTNLLLVDGKQVLDRLAAVPISTWNYKSQATSVRHVGPMAQDFAAAFGVGDDDRHITTVDADGVAMAAIQGLNSRLKEKDGEIEMLKRRLMALEKLVDQLVQRRSDSQ